MSNKELVKIFKAMGNDRRFMILRHILVSKELTVSQIAKKIDLSFKSVSRHLSVLSNAGMVEVRQANLNRFYSIKSDLSKKFIACDFYIHLLVDTCSLFVE